MAALSSATTTTASSAIYQSRNSSDILQICISPTDESDSHPVRQEKRRFDTFDVVNTDSHQTQEEVYVGPDEDIKWPLLHGFDIDSYRLCLALSSQTFLWKTLDKSPSLHLWRISESKTQLAVWCMAVVTLVIITLIYTLKCVFYANVVQEEYLDRVGVNYFFAPWISSMLLCLAVPGCVANAVNPALWWVFVTPVILLEIKIYGQWFSGGIRRLSEVAIPPTYISIVGNFVGAMLGARLGCKEPALFVFAVGCAHYMVLFVTLYQRLPTNEELPKDLNPTFFLSLAAPSTASLAWEAISGTFGLGSKIPYFLSLFLFASMVVRVNFFRKSRFSVAWWAYVLPVTTVAIASIVYADHERSPLVKTIAFVFSILSIGTVTLLFVATLIHCVLSLKGTAPSQHCMGRMPSKKRKIYQVICLGANNPNPNEDIISVHDLQRQSPS